MMGDIVVFHSNIHRQKRRGTMQDITIEKKIEIEKKVCDILSSSGFHPSKKNNSLIVDIVQLVKGFNFDVQTSEMDLNTTGCLIVNELNPVMDTNKNRLIVVNKHFKNDNNDENVILKKSRFITAHEYGHFVLHKQEGIPIYAHRDSDNRTEPRELEADYFARSILMPYGLFEQYIDTIKLLNLYENDEDAVPLLSNIFKVTKDKISRRLEDLTQLRGLV